MGRFVHTSNLAHNNNIGTIMATGTIGQIFEAPLVAIGMSDATPTKSHVLGGMLYGLVGGWIAGVARGKAKPSANVLGF